MSLSEQYYDTEEVHPIDIVETLAEHHEWDFDRIAEDQIEKALSPFGQVDTEHSRDGSGTGLGLTIVDALVRLHGGEFQLISQEGTGTTARVTLPPDRVMNGKEPGKKA